MRIGIDARKINDTGIGRYISNLVDNLIKIGGQHHYVLFMQSNDVNSFDFPKDTVTKVVERSGKYSIAEHWSLSYNATSMYLDLFHSPHYVLPLFLKIPSVVTVHDLIHITEPGYGTLTRNYARFMVKSAVKRARRVISVSGKTRDDLTDILGAPAEKIKVIYNGGGADFSRTPDDMLDSILARLGLKRGYVLFAGSDRPHKNLRAVLKTMEILPETRFAIAGRVLEENRRAFSKFGERVSFIEIVPRDEMEALYSGAMALLFPSYAEGFGLPPLEAMACKTPVVASSRAPMPEVVGDAALLVDPDDHAGMAKALRMIASDTAYANSLVAKGTERLKMFSWEKMARETLAVYEEAVRR